MIEEALRAHILAQPGLSDLVASRVFPLRVPQNETFPAIVYQMLTGPRVHSLTGASGLAHPRFQITCWAELHSEARAVAELVLRSFDLAPGVVEGVTISASIVDDVEDDYDEDARKYARRVFVTLWHNE